MNMIEPNVTLNQFMMLQTAFIAQHVEQQVTVQQQYKLLLSQLT